MMIMMINVCNYIITHTNVFVNEYMRYNLLFHKYMQRGVLVVFDATLTGKRIKELRGNVSQDKCAQELGISRGALSFYENGDRKPDAEILYKMCNYFSVSADYLLGLSNNKTTDFDIAIACKVTGLSETAIKHISALAIITDILKTINSAEIINNLDVSDKIESKVTESALNAYSVLSALGIGVNEFTQYITECSILSSPIKTFDILCNQGIFEKICIYMSFYINDLVENKINSKETVLDDSFEDYTIWKLQNMISSEFRNIIQEIRNINGSEKEAQNNGEHNPSEE